MVSIKEMLKSSGKKVTLQTESKLVSLKEECKLLAGSLTTKRKCLELDL